MIFGNKEQILYGNRFNGTKGNGYQPIKKEQTNEEWFDGLSTEEKAKYIAKSMFFYDSQFGLTMVEALRKSIEYEDGLNETIEHDVLEWLKQPHTTPQKQDDYPCNVKGCSLETRQACCGCPDYFEWEKQHKE